MNPKYPQITDTSLVAIRAIEVQLENCPDLLDRTDCPYPPHIRTLLKKLCGGGGKEKVRREFTDTDLEAEIQDLYEELRLTMVTGDAKDQLAMIKTRADLLTRMVALKERAMNVRDMGRFQRTVIEVIEGHLTPVQRNEVMESLAEYVR
jgi:hypothetical protein